MSLSDSNTWGNSHAWDNAFADTERVVFWANTPLAIELNQEAIKDIRRVTVHKRHRRYNPCSVEFVAKDNYTFAAVELYHWQRGRVTGVGFAKRRPTDAYDKVRGFKIALKRAIEAAINGD